MHGWTRNLLNDAQHPCVRRCARLLLVAVGVITTLYAAGQGHEFLRSLGTVLVFLGCTLIVAARTGIQADILERERQRAYDDGYADGLAARREAAEVSAGGSVLAFNRAAK